MAEADLGRYRFGPLERRGLLLGLRTGQVLALAAGGLLAVLALRALPSPQAELTAAVIAAAALGAAFWPIAGRPLEAWLPLVAGYGWRRQRGRHRFRPRAHLLGHLVTIRDSGEVVDVLPPDVRPASVRELRILEAVANGQSLGVIKDARRRTYVGVLRVQGHRSFALMDREEQARSVAAWASILAGFGAAGSAVSRLQWIERTLPDHPQPRLSHFEARAAADAPPAALEVYRSALASSVGERHECFLALEIDARKAWRLIRQTGLGDIDRGACALLLRELDVLGRSLEATEVCVDCALGPRQIGALIRSAYDPDFQPHLTVVEGDAEPALPHPDSAWPQDTVEDWSRYRSGSRAQHASFHVREWPRVEVGPDFLAPLLQSGLRRTVSMTLEPLPALQAQREVRRALAADASDQQLRERGGWLTSFRRLREQEGVLRADQELADGHVSYRFAAYLTVTAASAAELEAACTEVEQVAGRSQLELERLAAEQEAAFTYTLPLCRGLR